MFCSPIWARFYRLVPGRGVPFTSRLLCCMKDDFFLLDFFEQA